MYLVLGSFICHGLAAWLAGPNSCGRARLLSSSTFTHLAYCQTLLSGGPHIVAGTSAAHLVYCCSGGQSGGERERRRSTAATGTKAAHRLRLICFHVHWCGRIQHADEVLLSVVLFGHFQRPSVAVNMTISEYMRAKTASDGRLLILVSEHKAGAQGPAQIALESAHYKLFALYAKRFTCLNFLYFVLVKLILQTHLVLLGWWDRQQVGLAGLAGPASRLQPTRKGPRNQGDPTLSCTRSRVQLCRRVGGLQDRKEKYMSSAEESMGFMFSFHHQGQTFWRDATDEVPGPGRLINHSKCHPNVSSYDKAAMYCLHHIIVH